MWIHEFQEANPQLKGFYHLMPIVTGTMGKINQRFQKLLVNKNYQEYKFPTIGLTKNLTLEKAHSAFSSESYFINDSELYLKPTSEAIAYPLILKNLPSQSYPFRFFQVGSMFRKQSSWCRRYVRSKQCYYFFEAHALCNSKQQAAKQMKIAIACYRKLLTDLKIPFRIHRRPPEDRFSGSKKTIAFDTILPSGKALQLATVHLLNNEFCRPWGHDKFVCCFGHTQRIYGALRAFYGYTNFNLNYAHYALGLSSLKSTKIPLKIIKKLQKLTDVLKVQSRKKDTLNDIKDMIFKGHGIPLVAIFGAKEKQINAISLISPSTGNTLFSNKLRELRKFFETEKKLLLENLQVQFQKNHTILDRISQEKIQTGHHLGKNIETGKDAYIESKL